MSKSGYHNKNDKFPFSGRIICGTCGYTFMQVKDRYGVKVWRCKTFQGKRFTPKMPKSRNDTPANIKRRKKPVPRQMYCTDIKVPVEDMDKAFIKDWNFLVDHPDELFTGQPSQEVKEDHSENVHAKDILRTYRIEEHKQLLSMGKMHEINAEIVRRMLDYITVVEDGFIIVEFLSGVEVR